MAMGRTVLHMPSGHTGVVAKLHPTVLFNICDSFIRRNDQQERVIGTLLGSISADGTVEIRNSYAVPHSEQADQVAVDIDYNRTMYELHQRVNPKEVVVGWYSTGSNLSPSDTLIHDFYGREVANPVLLIVDTAFAEEKVNIKVFVSTLLTLGERQLAAQFHEVQLDLRLVEAERIGFDVLKKTMVEKLPNDLEGLEATIERLQEMIDRVFRYVDGVLEGQIEPDNSIGRFLADTMSAVPRISSDAFDKLFNDSVQDLLLVLYLANLTKTQLTLAEKLNTAAQIV
jgi:translation initiation factor 3 subunit F